MADHDIVLQVVGLRGYISAVTFLLTVAAPTLMFTRGAPRRNKFALRCVLCAAGMILFSELVTYATAALIEHYPELISYIIYFMTFKFFAIFILSGVCVKVMFDVNIWGALFCATAGWCLQHIQAKIGAIFVEFVIKDMYWVGELFFNLSVAAAFYALFWAVFLRKSKRVMSCSVNKVQVALAACVVGVNIFYNSFGIAYLSTMILDMQSAGLDTAIADKLMIFIYLMSVIVAALALALDSGVSRNKQLTDEKAVLSNILEEGKRQYEYEKTNMETINIKCHDLKHQLAAMKGKIYEEQIEELSGAIDVYDGAVKTGNEALDVVLTQKSLYCGRHGIRLTCILNGENYGFIPRHEAYSLFGNAIDNAIEAVEKLPPEKRVISVTERVSAGVVRVRIENYYDGALEMQDGLPLTNKSGEGHGYGVKSIKMIAEKNGGGISINTHGDLFTLNIFFAK